jgi:hypothetical protein
MGEFKAKQFSDPVNCDVVEENAIAVELGEHPLGDVHRAELGSAFHSSSSPRLRLSNFPVALFASTMPEALRDAVGSIPWEIVERLPAATG